MEQATEIIECPACGQRVRAGEKCPFCWPADVSRPKPPPLPREAYAPPPLPKKPRRSIIEILLDPRSIQWLLASGGVLLVTGMVIWLASLGIFKDAMVIAGTLGAGTLLLLGAGWWVIRKTSFHLAGQAVTLLACLVMPLNLWFYHAHGLMTLDGNLWVAAVGCCILYAASALVLRDPLFVYVLCAGIAGTGLLILSDMGKFTEIAAPSAMLVAMGLLCIHAERAFPNNETSEFSRKRFGLAFFFSGHALLGTGLLLLLGAQITGLLIKPILNITPSVIVTDYNLRLLAVALVLAGTYAYVYSDLVVRKIGGYVYPAAFTLLWAELLGLQLLDLRYGPEVIIATLSFTALLMNVVQALMTHNESARRFTRTLIPLGLLLSILPVVYGVLLHLRATHLALHSWEYTMGWGYVAAMLITAIACRIGAYVHRTKDETMAGAYLFMTGAATLVGAAGLLNVLGIQAWSSQAPILMLIPIAYLLASRLYKFSFERRALLSVGSVATVVMIFTVLASATHIAPRVFEAVRGEPINFMLAAFFAEAALFYALLATIEKKGGQVLFSTAMAGAAVWQVLNRYHVQTPTYMLTFAGLGLALLVASRFARRGDKTGTFGPGIAAMMAGDALMSLAFISSTLMVASKMLVMHATLEHDASLLGAMMLLTLLAAFVVGESGWRRLYMVMAVVDGALAFILLGALINLSGWQKAEIFFVGSGLLLLIAGHIGWFREQDGHNDTVSFSLLLGALFAGLPLLIASVVNRFGYSISTIDEIGLVTISTLMLITGLLLQLRSTTIVGGSLLALHIAMLLTSVTWKAQLAVGVYLAVGGGMIFLLGLALAIYRERLMELPGRIERREGLFRVLAWR